MASEYPERILGTTPRSFRGKRKRERSWESISKGKKWSHDGLCQRDQQDQPREMLGQMIFNDDISLAVRGEKDETSSLINVDVNETPTVTNMADYCSIDRRDVEFIGRAELLDNHNTPPYSFLGNDFPCATSFHSCLAYSKWRRAVRTVLDGLVLWWQN